MGGCRRPDPIRGSSSDQAHSGACRSEGSVLHADVPDGLGELAGQVDACDLRPALATEPPLRPLAPLSIVSVAGGVDGGLDEGPAQVLGTVPGEGSAPIPATRLADERAQSRVAGQLLGAHETVDVADLRGDRVQAGL